MAEQLTQQKETEKPSYATANYPTFSILQTSLDRLQERALPRLNHSLEHISLPKLEIITPEYDIRLDDINLRGSAPPRTTFAIKSYYKVNEANPRQSRWVNMIQIKKFDLSADGKFFFRIKRKVFKTYDVEGDALISLGGARMYATFNVDTFKEKPPAITLAECDFKIEEIDILPASEDQEPWVKRLQKTGMIGVIRKRLEHRLGQYFKRKLSPLALEFNNAMLLGWTQSLVNNGEEWHRDEKRMEREKKLETEKLEREKLEPAKLEEQKAQPQKTEERKVETGKMPQQQVAV